MFKPNERLPQEIRERLAAGLVDLGLAIEAEAKRELFPGHGVLTGTLRRSIHAAEADYPFYADNGDDAERGGADFDATDNGDRLTIAVGSGLVYSLAIHQGFKSFEGYHYITNALEKVRPRAAEIVARRVRTG